MGPLNLSNEGSLRRVEAEGLSYRYPSGRVGVEEVGLIVDAGEVVALLGPNGSGKSTLLRLLATDLVPGSGSLRLLGSPVPPAGPPLRRRIAFGPDQPAHLEALTGDENLGLFSGLRGGAPPTPTERRSALATFALAEAGDLPVSQYSFGMRRRLLLAQLLLPPPELLLLDEPTLGLDPDGVEALGRAVGSLAREGSSAVLATNEVRLVPDWAHRVIFLHRGRVVMDQSPDRLLEDLRGETRIRMRCGGLSGGPPRVEGVEFGTPRTLERGAWELEAVTRQGPSALARVVAALVETGVEIRELQVREPDLGDLFQNLTGESLE